MRSPWNKGPPPGCSAAAQQQPRGDGAPAARMYADFPSGSNGGGGGPDAGGKEGVDDAGSHGHSRNEDTKTRRHTQGEEEGKNKGWRGESGATERGAPLASAPVPANGRASSWKQVLDTTPSVPSVVSRSTTNSSTLSSWTSGGSSTASTNAAALDFSAETDCGFDEEFQRLVKVLEPDLTILKEAETFAKLSRLVRDFRHAAVTYGKVIISEKHLADENKSIKPATSQVGGFAGGEKFLAGNIFFRFPVDSHQIYGSDEFAAKEANHQLKGVTALYNTDVGLNLPLLAVISYHGFKLVAMSVLPIQGERTLCYGSSNGGQSVEHNNAGHEIMALAAQSLNLCKHPVSVRCRTDSPTQQQRGHQEQWLWMPCDMEVHRVRVGDELRHYVVDFARLFPAQCPRSKIEAILQWPTDRDGRTTENGNQSTLSGGRGTGTRSNVKKSPPSRRTMERGSHLVHMLRPELVRKFSKALSSDAFSNFASPKPEHQGFNADVSEAMAHLLTKVIPEVAANLDREPPPVHEGRALRGRELVAHVNQISKRLTQTLHREGVNMRFLGVVFERATSYQWRREVLLEALARLVKAMVRGEMRMSFQNVRTAVLTPLISNVTKVLNDVVGHTDCCGVRPLPDGVRGCTNCEGPRSQESLGQGPQTLCACRCDASCWNYRRLFASEVAEGQQDDVLKRRMFWCTRAEALLRERFWFRSGLLRSIFAMESTQFPKLSCTCCACLWKRCVHPARLFARLQHICKIKLSNPAERATGEALSAAMSAVSVSFSAVAKRSAAPLPRSAAPRQSVRTTTCFDLRRPFEEHDVLDLTETITVLPIMEYAQGTEAIIRAKAYSKLGQVDEAAHMREIAIEQLRTGLTTSPTDTRLLCNLGMAVEDSGDLVEAIDTYLKAVLSNAKHARSWYFLGRALTNFRRRLRQDLRDENQRTQQTNELTARLDRIAGPDFFPALKPADPVDSNQFLQRIQVCFEQACKLSNQNVDWVKEFANFIHYGVPKNETTTNRAIAVYKSVLELDPDHYLTLKNLAALLIKEAEFLSSGKSRGRSKGSATKAKEDRLQAMALLQEARQHLNIARQQEDGAENPMFSWQDSKIGLLGLEIATSLGRMDAEERDPSSITNALERLRQGFDFVERFRHANESLSARQERFFAEFNHRAMAQSACDLLKRIEKKLTRLFNPPMAPISEEFTRQANALSLECFEWSSRFLHAEISRSRGPALVRLRTRLHKLTVAHLENRLFVVDPKFNFRDAEAPVKHRSGASSVSVAAATLEYVEKVFGSLNANASAITDATERASLSDSYASLYHQYSDHFRPN